MAQRKKKVNSKEILDSSSEPESPDSESAPRSSHCYTASRSDVGVWMHSEERTESVARMVAIDAMVALGLNPNDFKTRDKIIGAISDRINATLDHVNDSIYRRAMESMASQMVHPKMTAKEMAEMQLSKSV